MPIKTVLVAGLQDPNNNIIRFCLDNFLRPTHLPDRNSQPTPQLDCAIIAIPVISHELKWEVQDAYKGKPIFMSTNGGVSVIREEFEKTVWGEGILHKIRDQSIPFSVRVQYILGRFFNRGDVIEAGEFKKKVDKITRADCGTNMANVLGKGKEKGIFSGKKHSSQYTFMGLTKKMYDAMLRYGLYLDHDMLVIEEGQTQILTPAATVPEMITVSPIPLLENQTELALTPQPEERKAQEDHPALELLLEQTAKQDAKIDALMKIVQAQQSMIAGLEQKIIGRFEETMQVHDGLFQLEGKLRGLDSESLSKASLMISFVLENFTPRKIISPATPRQLS